MPAGSQRWGIVAIAVWFILWGGMEIFHVSPEQAPFILGILAIVGGFLLIFGK